MNHSQKFKAALFMSSLCFGSELVSANLIAGNSKASRSVEMQVNEHFNFNSHRQIQLDVSAIGDNEAPLAHAILRIYVVDDAVTELDDERLQLKSLLTLAKTDAAGWVVHTVEVPQTYKKLLVEIQSIGIEQQKLVSLTDSDSVQVSFD